MINSRNFEHVVWVPQGTSYESDSLNEGWYFWDEIGNLGGGPYKTEKEAVDKLNEYAASLNK